MSEISGELDAKIRRQAKNRCGYCLVPQKLVSYKLEIEHIVPRGIGGKSLEENLWLACRQFNLSKGMKTHGFDTITFRRVKIFIRENKSGQGISFGAKIKRKLSVKLPAVGRRFRFCN